MPRQFHQDGLRVPYLAPWEREKPCMPDLVRHRGRDGAEGIAYRDEDPVTDRRGDELWVRYSLARGTGCANLAAVHPLRQRRCMSHMLCQVCGESTLGPGTGDAQLFVMRGSRPIRDGERTTAPPVHEWCAAEALRDCPHLRGASVAALVTHALPWGIAGTPYDPNTLQPLYDKRDPLPWVSHTDRHRIRWTLAYRTVLGLHGCTPVSIHDLLLTA